MGGAENGDLKQVGLFVPNSPEVINDGPFAQPVELFPDVFCNTRPVNDGPFAQPVELFPDVFCNTRPVNDGPFAQPVELFPDVFCNTRPVHPSVGQDQTRETVPSVRAVRWMRIRIASVRDRPALARAHAPRARHGGLGCWGGRASVEGSALM